MASLDGSALSLPWGNRCSGPMSINRATPINLSWLAGLFEGEGCFYTHITLGPRMEIAMTDHDVLLKAAKFLGNNVCGPYTYKAHRERGDKDIFRISLTSSRAIGWMMTLYTHFGERRRAKIREVVSEWRGGVS
jgi:hypothetical protein